MGSRGLKIPGKLLCSAFDVRLERLERLEYQRWGDEIKGWPKSFL